MTDMSGYSPRQKRVLLVSILASFVSSLDGFIVNVALPAIGRDLGGGLAGQEGVVGPLLGGFLIDAISWRAIFGINVLPIALVLCLRRTLAALRGGTDPDDSWPQGYSTRYGSPSRDCYRVRVRVGGCRRTCRAFDAACGGA